MNSKHEWKPGEYVGRPANELPGGTVCDVRIGNWAARAVWTGYGLFYCTPEDAPASQSFRVDDLPVIRIHKLGEPRPKTLADVPAGEVWKDPANGRLHWMDNFGQWNYCDRLVGIPHTNHGTDKGEAMPAKDCIIHEEWQRIGPIEGIKVGGVVYGEGNDGQCCG